MRKILIFPLVALFAAVILISGCQTAGQVVSSKPLASCPSCSSQVVTSSIKGLDFTRVECPTCDKVWMLPESAYEHGTLDYYCPRCEALIPANSEYQESPWPTHYTLNQLLY